MADPDFPPIEIPGDGQLCARLITTQGTMLMRLEESRTPRTVANFVGLATGSIDWTDPKTGASMKGTPMYDGVRFHRVIPGFMVQVGDPFSRYPDQQGRWGTGGPGYRFSDEIDPGLRHDGPGVVSMANAGPDTNGSQLFLCEVPTPHLDGKHAVFARISEGVDIITRIANVPTGARDCPIDDVVLEKVEVFRA